MTEMCVWTIPLTVISKYPSCEQHTADEQCCVVSGLSGFEICLLCMCLSVWSLIQQLSVAYLPRLCGNNVSHQSVMDHLQTSSDWEGEGRLVLASASDWLGLSITLPQGLNALLICLANIFFLFPQRRVHILSVFDVSHRRVFMKGLNSHSKVINIISLHHIEAYLLTHACVIEA